MKIEIIPVGYNQEDAKKVKDSGMKTLKSKWQLAKEAETDKTMLFLKQFETKK